MSTITRRLSALIQVCPDRMFVHVTRHKLRRNPRGCGGGGEFKTFQISLNVVISSFFSPFFLFLLSTFIN